MKTYKRLLFLSFLPLLFISCSQRTVTNPLLLRADSLMECCPDSALQLLQEISQPQKMSKAERAYYALLRTQADDKNYIEHTSDSLIQVAVDYYKGGSDRYKSALAYYYLGSVYRELGMRTVAVDAFLKAERAMPEDRDNDRLWFLIHDGLSLTYEMQSVYPNAVKESRKAYANCIARNDSLDLVYTLKSIAHLFLYDDRVDSSIVYYTQALEIIEKIAEKKPYVTVLANLAYVYKLNQELEIAENYATLALRASINKSDSITASVAKGEILYKLGNSDSARHYLMYGISSDNIYVQTSSYHSLFELERKVGNIEKCLEYMDHYRLLADSIYKNNRRVETLMLMNEHELSIRTTELENRQKRNLTFIGSVFVFLLLFGLFILLLIDRSRKKRIIKLQNKLVEIQTKTLMTDAKRNEEKDNLHAEYKELKDELVFFVNLYKSTDAYKTAMAAVAKVELEGSNLKSTERNEIMGSIYATFFQVSDRLKKRFSLSTKDVDYCLLHCLGFSPQAITAFWGVGSGAVRNRKHIVKKKIEEKVFSYLFE
ncbi:hypothetical protein D0T50_04565 [Bacteroides sp. 214]|uniref:tetratricopeptide repeat protein n=1 Tax=Bacteroides sp. 214 TaxID=2302935 RepID=UPI0013D4B54D|nr:hypothetical protein [Bacteroides sp. 214]NDW12163.1 hypothetical protein [Bacteroides sp. 214]